MYICNLISKNMNSKNSLSLTEARKNIFKLADEVQKGSKHYYLTEKGRAKAVLMSADEFDSWQETLAVEKIFPDLDKEVSRADEAVKSGAYRKWASLEEVMADYGFIAADKGRKKYEVGNKDRKKGAKRAG